VWVFAPVILLQSVLSGSITWHEEAGHQSLYLCWRNLGPQTWAIVVAAVALGILINIVTLWIQMGVTGASVKAARGEDIAVRDFFLAWDNVTKYILATMLYGLIVAVGTILLIIPSIIWALRYGLFGYYVVTQGAGPVEALRLSAAATEGHKGQLFGLDLLSCGIVVLGALCLGIGLL
jgi:uncharacterized membrane protein